MRLQLLRKKDAMCISDITRHLDIYFCNIFYCDCCEHKIQVNYTKGDTNEKVKQK